MATNLETVPGQRGYLVLAEDGSVIQSSGELQNDEHTAMVATQLVKNSLKLVKTINTERKAIHRLSVVYRNHTLVISTWNHKIYVAKRQNPES